MAKLRAAGIVLGDDAADRLNSLEEKHPRWALQPYQQEEFSHWMGGTGDPGYESMDIERPAPRELTQLMEWLKRPQDHKAFEFDDWADVCRNAFDIAIDALARIAGQGEWPTERWKSALQIWSDDQFVGKSWAKLVDILSEIPRIEMIELIQPLSWWLQAVAKVLSDREATFLELCTAVMLNAPDAKAPAGSESHVASAINQPVGFITQALLTRWFMRRPEDGQHLPDDLRRVFELLTENEDPRFESGRVLLAANVIALFRVDREWTEQHLIPRFRWASSAEALAAWQGFLWSPRLHRPFLLSVKSDFLRCALHFEELGEFAPQFAAFLTFNALDPGDTFTEDELRKAMDELPPDALKHCSQALIRALEGAGAQRAEYWRNRVLPYIRKLWPKSNANVTPQIASDFARLSLATGEAFPEAVKELRGYLKPAEYPDTTIQLAGTSNLAGRFPESMLQFLHLLIPDDVRYLVSGLGAILNEIAHANENLKQDSRYIRLMDLYRLRKFG